MQTLETCSDPKTKSGQWHLATYALPQVQRDILSPQGRLLRAFAPAAKIPSSAYRGPWPEESRWLNWVKTPSGHRLILADWVWQRQTWNRREEQAHQSVKVMLDFGGAYAWDAYSACTNASWLPDVPAASRLLAKFEQWQEQWEHHLNACAESSKAEWEAFFEAGLSLCLELAQWIGPEGCITYYHPPRRLSVGIAPW